MNLESLFPQWKLMDLARMIVTHPQYHTMPIGQPQVYPTFPWFQPIPALKRPPIALSAPGGIPPLPQAGGAQNTPQAKPGFLTGTPLNGAKPLSMSQFLPAQKMKRTQSY